MNDTTGIDTQARLDAGTELPPNETIRGLVLDRATAGAIGSLFAWGAINLGGWYFLGAESRRTLAGIGGGAGEFGIFMYGGAAIGAVMLMFAIFGATTKSAVVGWLDGLALIGVGLWNIVHDFALTAALQPHGYTAGTPSVIWIMLGCAQLVWGGRQIARFAELGSQPDDVDKSMRDEARARLQGLMRDPQGAPLHFAITHSSSFPFFTSRTCRYAGWLSEERAICIETNFESWFEIGSSEASGITFEKNVASIRDTGGRVRRLELDASSLEALREWAAAQAPSPAEECPEGLTPQLEAAGQAS